MNINFIYACFRAQKKYIDIIQLKGGHIEKIYYIGNKYQHHVIFTRYYSELYK